jgi:hypothetical protein
MTITTADQTEETYRFQYEQTTGTLLDRNNIALSGAVDGEVYLRQFSKGKK